MTEKKFQAVLKFFKALLEKNGHQLILVIENGDHIFQSALKKNLAARNCFSFSGTIKNGLYLND